MKVIRQSRGIPGDLKKQTTQIALESAADLSAYHLVEDDPFLPFVQTEVTTRLRDDFEKAETPVSDGRITTKTEVVFVIDDSQKPPALAGFATVKPRAPSYETATIVYVAVAKKYRGQGVFRTIMTEILTHYPASAIDCPVSLVPLYEKFGFKVEENYSIHVLMKTGELNGKIYNLELEDMMKMPPLRDALQKLKANLGKDYKEVAEKFHEQNRVAGLEAEAFVLARKSSQT